MYAKTVVLVSSTIELITGIALVLGPNLVAHLLLGVGLSDSGLAVARLCGIALVALAVACWPTSQGASFRSINGLLVYNALDACYMTYLRVGAGYSTTILGLACVLHGVLAILLARSAYERLTRKPG